MAHGFILRIIGGKGAKSGEEVILLAPIEVDAKLLQVSSCAKNGLPRLRDKGIIR